MSQQQMDFDETRRQQQEPQYGAGYGDPFVGMGLNERQKLSSQSSESGRGNPAGMRLALAIVSVCILLPISAVALSIGGGPFGGPFELLKALVGLGMICLTIMVVNIVFNLKR